YERAQYLKPRSRQRPRSRLRQDLGRDSCGQMRRKTGIGYGDFVVVLKRPLRAVETQEIGFVPLVEPREPAEALVVVRPRWKFQRVIPAAVVGPADPVQGSQLRISTIGEPACPILDIEA